MTFWVLASGAVVFFALTGFGLHASPIGADAASVANVLGVALVPTVIPILFINIAIKNVGPTYSAIIGALEPVTALVIGAELFNSAIESVVDLASPGYHKLAADAKDMAAGAVLICAIFSVVIGLIIFLPKAIAWVGTLIVNR